jgi:hypothetical protein
MTVAPIATMAGFIWAWKVSPYNSVKDGVQRSTGKPFFAENKA